MRGAQSSGDGLFSYVRLEERVPQDYLLRPVRLLVDEDLDQMSGLFEQLYSKMGRPSIPPEHLLRATLLQAFYSVRSKRILMEQIDYSLLFRWFIGIPIDAGVWHPTVYTKNRDRLLETDVAHEFLVRLLGLPRVKRLMSSEHFTVDGTLIDAWASMKSFRAKDGADEPPATGRNGERNFRRETRSNDTHASTTDPLSARDARLCRKGNGQGARLCFMGYVLMENRNGLAVDATLTHTTGTAERDATPIMLDRLSRKKRITLGTDKAYDVTGLVGDLRHRNVTPHIAIKGTIGKLGKPRRTAIDKCTTRHPGHAIGQRIRTRVEEIFGWTKVQAGYDKMKVRGCVKTGSVFTFAITACNLIRIPNLLAIVA